MQTVTDEAEEKAQAALAARIQFHCLILELVPYLADLEVLKHAAELKAFRRSVQKTTRTLERTT